MGCFYRFESEESLEDFYLMSACFWSRNLHSKQGGLPIYRDLVLFEVQACSTLDVQMY